MGEESQLKFLTVHPKNGWGNLSEFLTVHSKSGWRYQCKFLTVHSIKGWGKWLSVYCPFSVDKTITHCKQITNVSDPDMSRTALLVLIILYHAEQRAGNLLICASLICSFCSTQMSDCAQLAQIAQDKWATVSESLRSHRGNEPPWANSSGRSRQMNEWALCSKILFKKI